MNIHTVNLEAVMAQGSVLTEITDSKLQMTTTFSLNTRFEVFDTPIRSYVRLPEKYRLPLQIDLKVRMDSPALYLLLGKGHVTFGTGWQDNRRLGDILEPDYKPRVFNNEMSMDTYNDITVIYDHKFMQILINGEERYFSRKEKYMKSRLLEKANEEGFEVKLACSKQTELTIDSLHITEYESQELDHLRVKVDNRGAQAVCVNTDKKAKASFESCISLLSKELQDEILCTNDYLLSLKKLKLKRKIEGTSQACKITYVSPLGFSYSLYISENVMHHSLWWYMLSNYKYEDKFLGRKNDYTVAMLNKLAETSPDFAAKAFDYLDDCVGCREHCAAKTAYEYAGRKKLACHGKMLMSMNPARFKDLRLMVAAIDELAG